MMASISITYIAYKIAKLIKTSFGVQIYFFHACIDSVALIAHYSQDDTPGFSKKNAKTKRDSFKKNGS